MRTPKNTTALNAATVSLIILLFVCCNAAPASEDETFTRSGIDTVQSFSETNVEVYTVKKEPFSYLIRSDGKVRSAHEQLIKSEISGRLIRLAVKQGKVAASGSLVAQFETTPLLQKLERAELMRFNSEKEYASQLLGYENLLTGKSAAEADTIRKKLRISSGLSGAELDIREINYELKKALIRAPFTGLVADIKVQQGEQVTAGQELFRIFDPHDLFLEVKILESDMAAARVGTVAEIVPVANPSATYTAKVAEINPYVDEDGLVIVRLKILNASAGKVFPGMNCTSVIKVPLSEALVVPKEALVMRNGHEVVFTLENGKAKWNYVVVGRDNGNGIEIKDGLKEGQKVIVTNNLQLAHDAPVKEIASVK